ncbi:MAG TPA: hypothetical protein VH914_12055 [Acidimicrobiia bacterium]|jgi:hypothetical protein|nr:hypothetical protein [Acidimicrobiia bacterium]
MVALWVTALFSGALVGAGHVPAALAAENHLTIVEPVPGAQPGSCNLAETQVDANPDSAPTLTMLRTLHSAGNGCDLTPDVGRKGDWLAFSQRPATGQPGDVVVAPMPRRLSRAIKKTFPVATASETAPHGDEPKWSPDGRSLALSGCMDAGCTASQLVVASGFVAGSRRFNSIRVVLPYDSTNRIEVRDPVWVDNTHLLALRACSTRPTPCPNVGLYDEIVRVSVADGTFVSEHLTACYQPASDVDPYIPAVRDAAVCPNDVPYTADAGSGANPAQLMPSWSTHAQFPVWSPDRTLVAFAAPEAGNGLCPSSSVYTTWVAPMQSNAPAASSVNTSRVSSSCDATATGHVSNVAWRFHAYIDDRTN